MYLFLIRHGAAEMQSSDDARVLSSAGRAEAAALGKWLARYHLQSPTVWHSDKVRTGETASLIIENAGWSSTPTEIDGLRPSSPVEPITMKVAAEQSDLVIVGHIPFMSLMASSMLTGGRIETYWDFNTCGVLVLDRAGQEQWVVNAYLSPSML
ncbi:MAG: phosphoglycerate mutase family protein [Candidatus Hydrogenedentota bacterium]